MIFTVRYSVIRNGGNNMSKRGENIYKRKDGRWEGRYIRCYDENRKARYGYVYARSYNEVKYKLREESCRVYPKPSFSNKNLLYQDLLDAWLNSARFRIKESSYAHYIHLVNTHIRPYLGKYPVSRISTQLVEGFVENQLYSGRLDNGGPLSPKTVTDILAVVKNSFEYAKSNNIPVLCDLHKLTVKKKEKQIRVLSKQEQSALLHTLTLDMDLSKFGVFLSLYTGIRIGELCALQWEDLSFSDSTLKIHKTIQRIQDTNTASAAKTKIIITEPKSQCSIRDIPLPEFVMEYAKKFSGTPKAFILTGTEKKYMEPRVMQKHFKSYVQKSGIEDANFHALRHTFATRCVELGFEVKSLSEILGHSNVNTTLNRYVHSSFELKCSNMNKLFLFF